MTKQFSFQIILPTDPIESTVNCWLYFLQIWQCTWAVVLPCPNWIAKYVCKFEKLQKKSWMTICTKIVLEKKSKSWTAVQKSNLPNRFSEQQCTICLSGTAFAKKCPYRKLGRICLKQKFAQKIHSNKKSCLKWQFAILQMLKGINCQSQLVDSRFSLKLGAYLVQKSLMLRTSKKRIRRSSRYQSMKRWNFQQFICIHS